MFLSRSLRPRTRFYATVGRNAQDVLSEISAEHARVLAIVNTRVAERAKLTAESPEDNLALQEITRLREITQSRVAERQKRNAELSSTFSINSDGTSLHERGISHTTDASSKTCNTLILSRRNPRPLRQAGARCYASASATANVARNAQDILSEINAEHARVLRVVKNRVAERAKLTAELSEEMSSPEDIARLRKIKEMETLADAWMLWEETSKQLQEASGMMDDPDPSMRSLVADEIASLAESLNNIATTTFPKLLIPPSTTASLSALMELKSGVGGSEASLFLADMLRMYQRLANNSRWQANVVAKNDMEGGGIKDAIVEFKGVGAYDALRWESGVHRVQRVPATDSSGRTHTSTVAIVVLPLVEETETPDDSLFSMSDIKLEVMRSRGAGGQHVNKTESAVRLTHIPTGITVSMQDERSQHQNRRRAFQVLTSRLMDRKLTQEMEDRRASRRSLVKGADRSEKIRTYNYAQDRVTDHRIGLTLKNLTSVMEGDGINLFIDAVERHHAESVMLDMLEE